MLRSESQLCYLSHALISVSYCSELKRLFVKKEISFLFLHREHGTYERPPRIHRAHKGERALRTVRVKDCSERKNFRVRD